LGATAVTGDSSVTGVGHFDGVRFVLLEPPDPVTDGKHSELAAKEQTLTTRGPKEIFTGPQMLLFLFFNVHVFPSRVTTSGYCLLFLKMCN
jgi:hypothetical protein